MVKPTEVHSKGLIEAHAGCWLRGPNGYKLTRLACTAQACCYHLDGYCFHPKVIVSAKLQNFGNMLLLNSNSMAHWTALIKNIQVILGRIANSYLWIAFVIC